MTRHNRWLLRCDVFLLLQIATDFLEGEKYVSISGVIPIISGLAQKYLPCEEEPRTLARFKAVMLKQLKERFRFVFEASESHDSSAHTSIAISLRGLSAPHMSIATWLDPN